MLINLRLRTATARAWSGSCASAAAMRIVVVTDADSFASVILALRAGADDYIPQPVDKDELVDALLDRAPVLPPVPGQPLGLTAPAGSTSCASTSSATAT